MAQDYPLEELSPRAFEQMTVAVCEEVFGPGLEAFGSGPDGGREATFRGLIRWGSEPDASNVWDGYTVIQAKQREHHSPNPANNLKWLLTQIDAELGAWLNASSNRSPFPDYLLFVTNARISSSPGAGIDRLNAHLNESLDHPVSGDPRVTLRKRGLRQIRVWHRDKINALLTAHGSVRNGFKALLTVGDLLERLTQLSDTLKPEELHSFLHAHAEAALSAERWVQFQEAGGSDRESVEQIVIDLKITDENATESTVLSEIFARSSAVLKPTMRDRVRRPHVVITGRAGSGKSTITKFVTQALRSQFAVEETLTSTARHVREATTTAFTNLGTDAPTGRRWPVLVRLTDFASAIGPSGDLTLLRFLADTVSRRADIDIKPNVLKRWLTSWPSIVILDGLDEVTALEVRPRVLDAITYFVEDLEASNADLLCVVTTRPTSDAERFMPERFRQLNLTSLDRDTAERYGRMVTERRLADDPDRRDALLASLERQFTLSTMQRLMKTPLQVLIMTIILERVGTLPADRYQLYSQYFDTMYTREAGKHTTLAQLLASQNHAIVYLHETVGRVLHITAETSGGEKSVMPRTQMREILDARLIELEHDTDHLRTRIGDQIMQATTERLVLLVPAEDDGFAFEVRSLQELMAARSLVKTNDATLRRRLIALAPSPHWRATWVFMAGYVFSTGTDEQREMIVHIVENIDTDDAWPGWLTPIGPELAAALLDDGLATQTPKWLRRLVQVALRALTGPAPRNMQAYADGLAAAAGADATTRSFIRNTLIQSLAGTPRASNTARFLLPMTKLDAGISQTALRDATERILPRTTEVFDCVGTVLEEHVSSLPDPDTAMATLQPLLDALELYHVPPFGSGEVGVTLVHNTTVTDTSTAQLIDDPRNAALLEVLIAALPHEQWRVSHGVSIVYERGASRRPVSSQLD